MSWKTWKIVSKHGKRKEKKSNVLLFALKVTHMSV